MPDPCGVPQGIGKMCQGHEHGADSAAIQRDHLEWAIEEAREREDVEHAKALQAAVQRRLARRKGLV